MSTINDRLKRFLFEKKLTHKQVSRALDINDQQFNNWCISVKPSIDGLEKILRHFPDLNARWLMTGIGEPFWEMEMMKRIQSIPNGYKNYGFQTIIERLVEDLTELQKIKEVMEKEAIVGN